MIGILDYGSGNVKAFLNAYKCMRIECRRVLNPGELQGVERIILPGVGAFDTALRQFVDSGLKAAVEEKVLRDELPLLGVCVGMQMLASSSEEGSLSGLGWVPGRVRKLYACTSGTKVRLPHMGWNNIGARPGDPLLRELPHGGRFYFLHSYFFEAAEAASVAATVRYGTEFTCAIRRDNIYAVQFHPEKSHDDGMKLLFNFAHL